jgi:ribonucleoside-triphosphate reductase
MPVTSNYGMNAYQSYVHVSRYARFMHDLNRRESWAETVARYFDFFEIHLRESTGVQIAPEQRRELEQAVLGMQVMPSMRCIMTAGTALARDHVAGYNCAYSAIDNPKAWAEGLFVLMCGTGWGFSVERQFVNKLPEVPDELFDTDTVIVVADTKIGWARGLHELVQILYSGNVPKWDLSKLRPAGAILKTFGGRSSGPEPLDALFKFVVETFRKAKGRRLTSLECHDVACVVGNSVVVGGVRRSALISLSNLSDDRMRGAKTGQWWMITPHRRLANNSAVYNDPQPPMETFMEEWKSLYDSKSGERGIFSRHAARHVIESANQFRKEHFSDLEGIRYRDPNHEWGTNPCSEIILRDKQFCNLSEVVVRPTDTLASLKKKAHHAAVFGTWQSTLTDFRFLGKKWQTNTEDERLLGVSMTGVMDHSVLSGREGLEKCGQWLREIRKVAIKTNHDLALELGIPMAAAITANKPSGTVSSLVDSASGMHARHAPYYVRTARQDSKDPLAQLMIDQGFYHERDKMNPEDWVFFFPTKAPEGAITRSEVDAIAQLEHWKCFQMNWCEHKPSVSISVRDHEWMDVGAWVFRNFEWMSGVSFFPFSDHVYEQAPFMDCTEEQYHKWVARMPETVDWSRLSDYEKSDTTTGSQELSCSSATGCEI